MCLVPIAGSSAKSSTIKLITGGTNILLVQCSKNSARIAKAAPHKLPGKSSLNVRSVCPGFPGFPVCPDDHDDHDEHDYNDNHNHDNHDD